MGAKHLVLFLALCLACHVMVASIDMETSMAHMGRCRCLKFTTSAFSPKQIKSIKVIPRGIRCQRMEVILTTKNDWKICVRHNTPWVLRLLKQVTKRQ
uniref:Alveolar macrophage chemotactic factor-like n=1 Tax=Pogona vitticeps TaxID=103695 RepID=A0ABM5GKG8_9SAUR